MTTFGVYYFLYRLTVCYTTITKQTTNILSYQSTYNTPLAFLIFYTTQDLVYKLYLVYKIYVFERLHFHCISSVSKTTFSCKTNYFLLLIITNETCFGDQPYIEHDYNNLICGTFVIFLNMGLSHFIYNLYINAM